MLLLRNLTYGRRVRLSDRHQNTVLWPRNPDVARKALPHPKHKCGYSKHVVYHLTETEIRAVLQESLE